MGEVFTQKEMLVRILDKIDCMENKMDKKFGIIHEKINQTHELAAKTNGKVYLHTKFLFVLAGSIITLTGWFIKYLIFN